MTKVEFLKGVISFFESNSEAENYVEYAKEELAKATEKTTENYALSLKIVDFLKDNGGAFAVDILNADIGEELNSTSKIVAVIKTNPDIKVEKRVKGKTACNFYFV